MTTPTIFDNILQRIHDAGRVDLSEIEPCPDDYVQTVLPIPLDQCVVECQKVSKEFHARMKALGIEE